MVSMAGNGKYQIMCGEDKGSLIKKVVSIAVLIALFSFLLIMLLPAAASAQPAPASRSWNQVFELNKNQPDTSWQFSYVQFTDLHIGEGFNDYGTPGFDDLPPAGDVGSSAENLRQAVNLVNAEREQYHIKFVIVTGDMSDSGERSELLKCKEILDSLEVPYIPMIGNHDIWPYCLDANGTPINSQTPCGDQYYRDIFGSYLYHLRDSGYFYNWDDGTRNTPTWNGEADTLAGPNTGCYSYFDNYAFDYAGYHFIASDFNTRDRALLWWGGAMPAADLYDSDLCRGTWPWYKNHYNNYRYKAADNILTFLHQPLCTGFLPTWFTFDPIEYNTVTDFIHDNYYKDYTGLWAGGHFHVDTSPFFSPPFEYVIANRAGDYICPGVHTPAIKDDPNNFRIFKVWGKTARPKPTGVILYENENFSGRGEFFPTQDPDLSNNLIGANSASSLRIVGSGTVDLYRNTNYRGERLELTKDVPRLSAYGFGNAASSVAFNVPGVSGISPRYGATGTIARINDLSGARFEDGASVCLEKQGQESIRGDSVHVVNPETITCTFNLNRAALGQWDVVVTNPEGQTGILQNGFEVKQIPQINSVSPVSGTANSVVTINGVGFGSTQGNSRVYFGDKPARSIQSWCDTRIDVRVPNYSHGISNIKVQTDWGTSNTISFTVTKPLVKSISPGSAGQGQTLDVSITGADTNFKNGVSKASFSWKGISVNSMVVRDATHAEANITIARNAPVGPREVNVITGSEVPTALAGGFTVRKFELPPSPSANSTWYLAEGTSAWSSSSSNPIN